MNNLCPACGAVYNVTPRNVGRRLLCLKCRASLVVTDRGLECQTAKPNPPPAAPAESNWRPGMVPPRTSTESSDSRSAFEVLDDEAGTDRPRRPRWLDAFASGCGFVKWGMWANFAGFIYLTVLVEISLLAVETRARELVLIDKPGLLLPMYLFSLTGAGLMLAGWWRMTQVPSHSGAVGLMTGASILAGLRALALFVAMVYLIMAVGARGLGGIRYLVSSGSAMWIAEACLWVATFSAIPGMANVGGEIPSRRLRQQAGWVTLFHQILAIIVLALFATGLYLAFVGEFADQDPVGRVRLDDAPPARVERADRPARPVAPPDPIPIAMFFVFVLLAIHGAYTYLHASLYSVGSQAALRSPDRR